MGVRHRPRPARHPASLARTTRLAACPTTSCSTTHLHPPATRRGPHPPAAASTPRSRPRFEAASTSPEPRGRPARDPWAARSTLLRLRIAALLAILDRRLHVNIDDWQLAGTVKAISDNVRHPRTERRHRRGHAEGEADLHASGQPGGRGRQSPSGSGGSSTAPRSISDKVHAQPEGWTVSTLRRDAPQLARGVRRRARPMPRVEGWVIERAEPGQGADKRTVWCPAAQRASEGGVTWPDPCGPRVWRVWL